MVSNKKDNIMFLLMHKDEIAQCFGKWWEEIR